MLIRKALAHRVGLALGLFALAAVPASADTDNGYGYLRVVEGSATLMQAGSGTRTPAELNQPVLAGDRLWVPAQSRLEIELADRNLLRIDGGSEVLLERLAGSPDTKDRGTVLRLLEGNLQLVVIQESYGEELPRIDTPNATVYVQDYGSFRVTAAEQTFTELVVRRGRAEVVTDHGSEQVRANEQAVVEGSSRIAVEPAGREDTLERWAYRLDEEGNVDSEYLSDNLRYAAAPLRSHGSWISVQGSNYWRPRVAAGWRPYWNGRWAHTPSGMTWVSYDPWGYVPHHYGSWDYLPTHGWVWQPGYTYSPAWVYWYWGDSYTGWCPVGYYTRYYGSRWGHGSGFRRGVYGWAGGDWGNYGHWTFVPSNYWRGYRNGYRDGYRDSHRDGRHAGWRDQWNVQRYAVPVDELRRRGPLGRGVVTTDTRPIRPEHLDDPRRAVRVLTDDPAARRGRGANGELPDVTDFIARRPDLQPGTRRAVVADGDINQLDGSPLRPSTLGRNRGELPRGARALPGDRSGRGETPSAQPRIMIGDGDRPTARPAAPRATPRAGDTPQAGRPTSGDSGRGTSSDVRIRTAEPRSGARPAPNAPGGAPRPDRGVRAQPRDRDNNDGEDRGSSSDIRSRSIEPRSGARPAPNTPGGAPRPDRGVRPMPRDRDDDGGNGGNNGSPAPRENSERPQAYRRIDPGSERPADSPRSSSGVRERGSGGYERPEPSTRDRGRSSAPPEARVYEPRVYQPRDPEPYEPRVQRPAPPSSNRGGGYDRPSTRVQERSAPPSSSRGSYDRPTRSEPRVQPRSAPPSSEGSSTRPAPERRSSDRGTASRGSSSRGSSSEGRSSSRRAAPRDNDRN